MQNICILKLFRIEMCQKLLMQVFIKFKIYKFLYNCLIQRNNFWELQKYRNIVENSSYRILFIYHEEKWYGPMDFSICYCCFKASKKIKRYLLSLLNYYNLHFRLFPKISILIVCNSKGAAIYICDFEKNILNCTIMRIIYKEFSVITSGV